MCIYMYMCTCTCIYNDKILIIYFYETYNFVSFVSIWATMDENSERNFLQMSLLPWLLLTTLSQIGAYRYYKYMCTCTCTMYLSQIAFTCTCTCIMHLSTEKCNFFHNTFSLFAPEGIQASPDALVLTWDV